MSVVRRFFHLLFDVRLPVKQSLSQVLSSASACVRPFEEDDCKYKHRLVSVVFTLVTQFALACK